MSLIAPIDLKLKSGVSVVLKSPLTTEAELLLGHLRRVFGESYRNMNHPADHFDHFCVEHETEIIQDFSASRTKFMLSAFMQNEIIGNLGFFGGGAEFLKHSARIGMGIEKAFHNMGLGSALLKYAIQEGRALGFHRLELTVRTFNGPAIQLYEKVGFQRVGLLKDMALIDGQFHDEYYYQMLL